MAKLIRNADKTEVKSGDLIKDFRGEEAVLTGFQEPQSYGSSGRVYVKVKGEQRAFFPGVYDLTIVD